MSDAKQKFTPEMRRCVNAVDRNTRGVAKVVSAWRFIRLGGVVEFGVTEKLDKALNELLDERMGLRDALEKELRRQAGWRER